MDLTFKLEKKKVKTTYKFLPHLLLLLEDFNFLFINYSLNVSRFTIAVLTFCSYLADKFLFAEERLLEQEIIYIRQLFWFG